MRDLFLVHTHLDVSLARGLGETLAARGINLARPASVWPGCRILGTIDQGLHEARHALVLITDEFLRVRWTRYELDALADREPIIPLLCGVDEDDVSRCSGRLAVAAIPGCYHEDIVRLVRDEDD